MRSQCVQRCSYTRFEFNINSQIQLCMECRPCRRRWTCCILGTRWSRIRWKETTWRKGQVGRPLEPFHCNYAMRNLSSMFDRSNSSSVWSERRLPVRNMSFAHHFCLEFQEKRFLSMNLKPLKLIWTIFDLFKTFKLNMVFDPEIRPQLILIRYSDNTPLTPVYSWQCSHRSTEFLELISVKTRREISAGEQVRKDWSQSSRSWRATRAGKFRFSSRLFWSRVYQYSFAVYSLAVCSLSHQPYPVIHRICHTHPFSPMAIVTSIDPWRRTADYRLWTAPTVTSTNEQKGVPLLWGTSGIPASEGYFQGGHGLLIGVIVFWSNFETSLGSIQHQVSGLARDLG